MIYLSLNACLDLILITWLDLILIKWLDLILITLLELILITWLVLGLITWLNLNMIDYWMWSNRHRSDCETDGSCRYLYTDTGARAGQTIFDARRECVLDSGPRNGRDGSPGAGHCQEGDGVRVRRLQQNGQDHHYRCSMQMSCAS